MKRRKSAYASTSLWKDRHFIFTLHDLPLVLIVINDIAVCGDKEEWLDMPAPESGLILDHIKSSVLVPFQPHPPEPPTLKELNDPPWLDLGSWKYVESAIRQLFVRKVRGQSHTSST